MSEDVTVSFEPHEWQPWPVRHGAATICGSSYGKCMCGRRYYYDTIKIFCGELSENLIVQIA